MTSTDNNPTPLRIKEMRPSEIAAVLVRDPRLIVPVGSCEPHGMHLPVGAGTMIVERLADDLSARFGVLRAPTVEYGVNLPTDSEIPGNASVRRKTLHRLLNDLLASWEGNRIRHFVLLTCNGYDPHIDALSTVITQHSEVRVVDVLSTGIGDLLTAQKRPFRGDEADTSLLMYIAPALVDSQIMDRMMSIDELKRYRRGMPSDPVEKQPMVLRPSAATAEKGEAIYQRIYARVAARVLARDMAQEISGE